MGEVPERVTLFMFIIKFIQKRNLFFYLSSPSQVLGELKKRGGLEEVAHTENPGYLGGVDWRIVVQGHTGKRINKTPFQLISQVSPQLYSSVTLVL
jgi:hypothetical protein